LGFRFALLDFSADLLVATAVFVGRSGRSVGSVFAGDLCALPGVVLVGRCGVALLRPCFWAELDFRLLTAAG
jgi:hypothetical protein